MLTIQKPPLSLCQAQKTVPVLESPCIPLQWPRMFHDPHSSTSSKFELSYYRAQQSAGALEAIIAGIVLNSIRTTILIRHVLWADND